MLRVKLSMQKNVTVHQDIAYSKGFQESSRPKSTYGNLITVKDTIPGFARNTVTG